MKDETAARLAQIDKSIREGAGKAAQDLLGELFAEGLERDGLETFASLCLRAGIPDLGIKALAKLVRGRGRESADATSQERIVYAACLIRVGAIAEGMRILGREDADRSPQALNYLYYGCAARWDYSRGIELLQRYLRTPGLPIYQRRVAQANLVSALVNERRHFEAQLLLDELLQAARVPGQELLLAAVTDFAACNYLLQKRYADARRFLDTADSLFRGTLTLDAFFNRKWRAILDLCESSGSPGALTAVEAIREEARQKKHWETLRDCDRYQALVCRDLDLLKQVYCGTPYESFRARLAQDWGAPLSLGDWIPWSLGKKDPTAIEIPLFRGTPATQGMTDLLVRLFHALCSDFYRPVRVAPLFFTLYPEELYNPEASAHRVHEAVNRARKWLDSVGYPLAITEEDGSYRLVGEAPCRVWVPVEGLPEPAVESKLPDFASLFPSTAFTARELAEKLSVSPRSAQRMLDLALKEGLLRRQGAGRATRYELASQPLSQPGRTHRP